MKSFKEQADELIKKQSDLDFFVELFTYKEPDKEKEEESRIQLGEVRAKIETLIQAGEYFIDLINYDLKIFEGLNFKEMDRLEEKKKELKEIQESITKLKESIK